MVWSQQIAPFWRVIFLPWTVPESILKKGLINWVMQALGVTMFINMSSITIPPKMVTLRLENPPHLSMIFPAMNFHLVRGFPMTCDTSPALLGAPKSLHVRACLDSRNQRGGGNPVWIVSNWGISWKKQPILATEEGKTENPTILFSWFNQLNLHLVRGLPSCVWRLGGKHL